MPLVAGISIVAKVPPQVVLPALTFAVGIWFLFFGILGLGFIFDLIPVFICIGLVTAFAIIVLTLQVPIVLGLLAVPQQFQAILPGTLKNLSNISGRTVAISTSAVLVLGVFRFLHQKWGTEPTVRGKASRLGVASAGLLVILVYTGVSSAFLGPLPIQQQVAPFILPESLASQAPPTAAAGDGTVPAQAVMGNSTIQPAMSAAMGNSSKSLSGSAMGANNMALVDPMLRRANVALADRQLPSAQPQIPAQVPAGNLSATAQASTEKPGPAPKLPFWSAFPEFTTVPVAASPVFQLVKGLFLPSFLVFIVINIEHIVVAKFFAHEQGYTISKSQEMFSLGLINIVNSLFGGVPVGGGDMTRSSILGFTGAKSPLNQVFASCAAVVAIMPASGALRFMPQAALSAIAFIALFDQMPPQILMNLYFKLSFADFLIFFLSMNAAIPAPAGLNGVVGIGLGVIYMIFYTLFRSMFAGPKIIKYPDLESSSSPKDPPSWPLDDRIRYESILPLEKDSIPASTLIIKSDVDIIWTNAERVHRHIMNAAFLYNSGIATEQLGRPEPPWNMQIHKHIHSIRKRHERRKPDAVIAFRPRLRIVIFDFSMVAFIDTSALMQLDLAKKQLRYWAGDEVEFRFVGLNKHLLRRFRRGKWPIVDPFALDEEGVDEIVDESVMKDLMFPTVPQALGYKSQYAGMDSTFEQIIEDAMDFTNNFGR